MNDDEADERKRKLGRAFLARTKRKVMLVYPIKSRTISLDHQAGTKSYHLHLIEAANGHCVVINRWGKTGAFGEMKVETYDSPIAARKAIDKKENEKTRKGYRQVGAARETSAEDVSELVKAIGMAPFNKMGATAVEWLDPDFDTSGMREADGPQYDEETGRKLDTARKANIEEARAEARRREVETAQQAYAENELYGRF
jgi:predicted DNA-binding WGR domain protein